MKRLKTTDEGDKVHENGEIETVVEEVSWHDIGSLRDAMRSLLPGFHGDP